MLILLPFYAIFNLHVTWIIALLSIQLSLQLIYSSFVHLFMLNKVGEFASFSSQADLTVLCFAVITFNDPS